MTNYSHFLPFLWNHSHPRFSVISIPIRIYPAITILTVSSSLTISRILKSREIQNANYQVTPTALLIIIHHRYYLSLVIISQSNVSKVTYRKSCRVANKAIVASRGRFYNDRIQAATANPRKRWSEI